MSFTKLFVPCSRKLHLRLEAIGDKVKKLEALCEYDPILGFACLKAYMHHSDALNKVRGKQYELPEMLTIEFGDSMHKWLVRDGFLSGRVFEPHTQAQLWVLKREGCNNLASTAGIVFTVVEPFEVYGLAPDPPLTKTTIFVPLPEFQGRQFVSEPMVAFTRTFGYYAMPPVDKEIVFIDELRGYQHRSDAINSWIASKKSKPDVKICLLQVSVDFATLIELVSMDVTSGSVRDSTTLSYLALIFDKDTKHRESKGFSYLLHHAEFGIEFLDPLSPHNPGRIMSVTSIKP